MIILDISMPGMRGIEVTREIKSIHPEIKIVILTMHKIDRYIQLALEAGADGYMFKETTGNELFNAISCVREGGNYVSNSISKKWTPEMIKACRGGTKPQKKEILTIREKEILKLIAEGKPSKEIAELLFISIHTVNTHRVNLIRKLKMRKPADLARYAIKEGYVFDSNTFL